MKISRSNSQFFIVIIVILLASNLQLCWSLSDNISYDRQTLLDIKDALSHPCPYLSLPSDLDPALSNSVTTTTRPRKRGRRGGVRNRVRRWKNRPFVPSVIFGNCRSIHNKTDELWVNCRFLHQYRECCCIGLTETWLHPNIPTSATEIP